MIIILKQAEILKCVTAILKTKFKYPIYVNEIQEVFKTPCFFIKLIKTTTTNSFNTNSNILSIVITYFSSKEKNKEIEYMNLYDDIVETFENGFKTDSRYLHINNITSERIGEKQDILQIIISVNYFDFINKNWTENQLIQEINLKTTIK